MPENFGNCMHLDFREFCHCVCVWEFCQLHAQLERDLQRIEMRRGEEEGGGGVVVV